MPILDGIEVLKRLPERTYATIVLSGHSEFEYAQQAIRYGVVEYLLKPVEKDKLMEALNKAKRHSIYLNNLPLEVHDKYKVLEKVEKVSSVTLTKALNYIDANYQNRITLEDLVEVTNKSTTSINSRFQRHLNTTFIEYLTLYRIQKSLDLIRSTSIRCMRYLKWLDIKTISISVRCLIKYWVFLLRLLEPIMLGKRISNSIRGVITQSIKALKSCDCHNQ